MNDDDASWVSSRFSRLGFTFHIPRRYDGKAGVFCMMYLHRSRSRERFSRTKL